jgi:hypothetical protein
MTTLNHPIKPKYQRNTVVILEALSATGLRSIRYAKEIPLVKSAFHECLADLFHSKLAFCLDMLLQMTCRHLPPQQ